MTSFNVDINKLAKYLLQTLSPDINWRKPAEKYLELVEDRSGFTIILLTLINSNDIEMTIRIAGSITFKNCIKRNWCHIDDSTVDKISEFDRNKIKSIIVEIMLRSPEQIQRQLSDSISIIGRNDFPQNWPNLLDDMVNQISNVGNINFQIINAVLQTAHSLFKRYRHEYKSNELWVEIKCVLDRFAKPFTDLFVFNVQLVNTHKNNPQILKIIFRSLVLCSKIFNSLNAQDLPEFFEDNIQIWMNNFLYLLSVDNKCLRTEHEEEAGLLEQLKSQICDNIGMYVQKYNEEFQPYFPSFVETVLHLLINTGPEPKYDFLVSNAIHFISSVADHNQYKHLFQVENLLDTISSKIIIPNMEFRVSDEELFEDNPEEYIRRDIECSDIDTRRRAACDLIKSLSRHFEKQITIVFGQYIDTMLLKFTVNPKINWKCKDAAHYLVISLAVKSGTSRLGTIKTSELVNISNFFIKYVHSDLTISSDLNELAVLRADALKYIMTFRNQLSLKDIIIPSMPLIIEHLKAPSIVVHTYAALTIVKLLTMRDPNNTKINAIKAEEFKPFIGEMLNLLFNILSIQGSNENEYAMKAIMLTFSLMKDNVLPYFDKFLPKLTLKLSEVAINPSKPNFNHYIFETLSLSINIACEKNSSFVTIFEASLFPIFNQIITGDVQEFMPYVFQILSLMLELNSNSILESYMELFPHLLSPVLWNIYANIAPLVRLIQAFIEKSGNQIFVASKLQSLLALFQKLVASKNNDHQGFYLLQSIIEFIDPKFLEPYIEQIFSILFKRLISSKTTKYVKCLLIFFSLFTYKCGSQVFLETIDNIQPRMFGMVLEKLYMPELQRVSGKIEKKICSVGITKILCELEATITGDYYKYWAPLLQSLICLFELPEDDTIPDDEHFIEIEYTTEYKITYSQLVFAGKCERDPFQGIIVDSKLFLAQSLGKLSARHPGKLRPLISDGLDQIAIYHLNRYCSAANVNII